MTTAKTTTKPTTVSAKMTTGLPMTPSVPPAPNITSTASPINITSPDMMNLRSSGSKGKDLAQELEEICQMNKKNYQIQRQRKEEEEKRQKDEEASTPVGEDPIDPRPSTEDTISNFLNDMHNIMNGVQDMETNDTEMDNDEDVRSPVKKCQGSSKTSSRQNANVCQIYPTKEGPTAVPLAQATTFLDNFIYPHSHPADVAE